MNKSDGFPSDLDSEISKIYKTAVWRFLDQTIMRPNKSVKPKWANSNLDQVVYHHQAFTLTFYHNVMKRSGRLAKRTVSEKDLSMQDRARLLAPAMMLSVLFAFQSAISEIRDELTIENERRDKETGLSKSIKWMSCSDMFGAVDPLQRKAWQNFLGRLDEQTAQESRNQPSSNNAMTAPKTMNKQVLKSTAVFFTKKSGYQTSA